MIASRDRRASITHGMQLEFRNAWRADFLIAEELDVRRMIDRQQADLVEVGRLPAAHGLDELVGEVRRVEVEQPGPVDNGPETLDQRHCERSPRPWSRP